MSGEDNFIGSIMSSYCIENRRRADGTIKYRCKVVLKEKGKVIHQESKTFDKKASANAWGKRRSNEIDLNGLSRPIEYVKINDLIDRYLTDPKIAPNVKRTKGACLTMLKSYGIAKLYAHDLKSSDIIEHCHQRISSGAKPATVAHDYFYLKSVFKAAKPFWGMEITEQPYVDAKPMLEQMNLIGKSQRRTRRLKKGEYEALEQGLKIREEHRSAHIPFVDIFQFSILTCMRLGEVTNLKWDDLDNDTRTILCRDRKDPRKKEGNHMRVPLLGEAYSIAIRQPKKGELIFPYNPKSIGSGFRSVRKKLGIKELTYHDLRREGASRLFERDYRIEEVAQVTGHKDLKVLWNVYTALNPENLHRDM